MPEKEKSEKIVEDTIPIRELELSGRDAYITLVRHGTYPNMSWWFKKYRECKGEKVYIGFLVIHSLPGSWPNMEMSLCYRDNEQGAYERIKDMILVDGWEVGLGIDKLPDEIQERIKEESVYNY